MRLIDADALLEKMDTHCKLCPHSDGVHVCRRECDWHEAMDEVDDMPQIDAPIVIPPKLGKWRKVSGGMSPGGTPLYECGFCGGSEHLHGAECQRRKVLCDRCGAVLTYPWEKTVEEEDHERVDKR